MSSKKCCVSGCLNAYPKAPKGTTWHPLPKNEDLAKKWIAKLGENFQKWTRNSVVCSDHFDERDFKALTQYARNIRILSSSAVPSILKCRNNKKIAEVDVYSEVHVLTVLPLDVWENIIAYLTPNDVISLSSTCKDSQKLVQIVLKKFDFGNGSHFNLNGFMRYTLSPSCTGINLNHCHWLKASEILDIICKTNVKHLHVIECNINNECMQTICDLNLTSLSISYNKDWRFFFLKRKTEELIRGLRELKNLELFYKRFPSNIILEMYNKVLIHCKGLEHLKVFQCISQSTLSANGRRNEERHDQIPLEPTLVPELKSLVINLQALRFQPNVARFIALILKDKAIHLKRADFGHQTGYLIQKKLLPDPKIIWDNSTLSLSCLNTDFNFWLNFPTVREIIAQPDYKTVEIKNVELEGFYKFAQQIASNSGTLKKLRVKHRHIFHNGYSEFLDGLSLIALNCSQITVFDISCHMFNSLEEFLYINNDKYRKHQVLLNALANLKHLKKLAIPANILHCKYYNSNGEKRAKAIPFWKVTSACKSLTEIRISYSQSFKHGHMHHVHEKSLYCIASCAKLRTLHLVRFQVQCSQSSTFSLSRITQSCSLLQELYIRDIRGLSDIRDMFCKNMKIISYFGSVTFNDVFLKILNQCPNLEKLYLGTMYTEEIDFKVLEDVLRKLNNLKAFVVRDRVCHPLVNMALKNWRNGRLDSVLKTIADERPGFFYLLKEFDSNQLPSVHLDALYHDGLDDYYIGYSH